MKNKSASFVFLIFLFACNTSAFSQDSLYARTVINKLTSDKFYGRGYVSKGDRTAAKFIAGEFEKLSLKKLNNNYFQDFTFGVNTFPSSMKVTIDGKELKPGVDYIVYPSSGSSNETYSVEEGDSASAIQKLKEESSKCWFIPNKAFNANREFAVEILQSKKTGAVVLVEDNKLTWSVGRSQLKIPVIILLKKNITDHPKKISFKMKSAFNADHHTQNVLGYVEGSEKPDSFIVFSAHYDHLGMMGKKTIFPGANDNASGVSMMLNLAKHYSNAANKPKCSMVFIAFAGEEAGLLGSKYYTDNPLFDLRKIKFLINLDLLGTGDEGITVVNATEYKEQFQLLKSINAEKNYLPFIGERGKAKNSDHFFFSEKGVPSFFIYTMGGIKAYHDVDDIAKTLPLSKYKETFRLIRDFADKLQ